LYIPQENQGDGKAGELEAIGWYHGSGCLIIVTVFPAAVI
jgi:hypothetical protein